MTVLSDKTIKERIANNELVPGGNANNATHCSYEFTAESMLWGGRHHFLPVNKRGVVIKPVQLVWIRAREEISMPAKMLGLWIQTQTLARKGLLLLNISLIEPGYEGPLSAVLVNFGNKKVTIRPDTKIAKVVFLPLDSEAAELVKKCESKEKYDAGLMDMAANAPRTFLQLQSFETKADDILGTMKKQMEKEVNTLSERVKYQLKDDLQNDLKSILRKYGLHSLFGLALGCAIVWIMINSYLPRLSEYSQFDELVRRAAMTQQSETITEMNVQLRTLTTEIESLKKQMQSDASDTNPSPDTNNAIPNQ